jgi:multidrug efflux pump subunit AcrB
MVTARFIVGTQTDSAILRVHDKVRANIDRIPVGIPEPLIVGRGIDDVAIVSLTLTPSRRKPGRGFRQRPDAGRPRTQDRTLQDRQCRPDLSGRRGRRDHPHCARSEAARALRRDAAAARRQGAERQPRLLHAGQVRDNGEQIDLVAGETLTAPAEIGNLLITSRDARPVYVRDRGDMWNSLRHVRPDRRNVVTRNGDGGSDAGRDAGVAKRAGANAVVVAEEILQRTEELEGHLIPKTYRGRGDARLWRDRQREGQRTAVPSRPRDGLDHPLVWFAIGWREAIVVAIVIPVTILLTLFAAWIMGYTLNRVSLFALIFSIGILVDDAIVVIENIARHWGMSGGKHRVARAIEAVAEVGNPTIVATLTVVAALLPMLFVSGLMGPYMSPIPANASAAMIFSFFVAVIVTPWLMAKIAGGAPVHDGESGAASAWRQARRALPRFAKPILATKDAQPRLPADHGGAVVRLAFAALHQGCDGQAAAVRQQVGARRRHRHAGRHVGGATDAVAQAVARTVTEMPEVVKSVQTHAGTAAPFNFNGLVRHYYLRARIPYGRPADQPDAERPSASAKATRSRWRSASGSRARRARRRQPEDGRAAARPAGDFDAARRGLWPGRARRAAPRHGIREAFEAVPISSSMSTASAPSRRRLRG